MYISSFYIESWIVFGLWSSLDAPIAVSEHGDAEELVAGVPHLGVEIVDKGRHVARLGVLQVDASLPLDFCNSLDLSWRTLKGE